MQINLGGIDRGLRVIAGVALLVWAFMGGPVWAWIGLVPLATAVVGFCPLYRLLGLRTCRDPAACAIKP